MICDICLLLCVDVFNCTNCSKRSCRNCVFENTGKCCYCNYVNNLHEREVQRQIHLVGETRNGLTDCDRVMSAIKKCPGCATLIEKDGCQQILCTICKTVWMWDTLKVVSDVGDVHNPMFFELKKITVPGNENSIVGKCLKMLSREPLKYASDTYLLRVMFINEQMSFTQFKDKIIERYKLFIKNTKLFDFLNASSDVPEEAVDMCRTYLFG